MNLVPDTPQQGAYITLLHLGWFTSRLSCCAPFGVPFSSLYALHTCAVQYFCTQSYILSADRSASHVTVLRSKSVGVMKGRGKECIATWLLLSWE